MTTAEEQDNDMDQQRIDELQNQYFRQKLATMDAERLQEAKEFLERTRRPSDERPDVAQLGAGGRCPNKSRPGHQNGK